MVTLGIELDSVNQLARLPNDKLTSLLNLLHRWSTYRWCIAGVPNDNFSHLLAIYTMLPRWFGLAVHASVA